MDSDTNEASIDYEEQVHDTSMQEMGQPGTVSLPATLQSQTAGVSVDERSTSAQLITDAELAAFLDESDMERHNSLHRQASKPPSDRASKSEQLGDDAGKHRSVTPQLSQTPTADSMHLVGPAQEHHYSSFSDGNFSQSSAVDSQCVPASEPQHMALSVQQHADVSSSRRSFKAGSPKHRRTSSRSSYGHAMSGDGTAVGIEGFEASSAPIDRSASALTTMLQRASSSDNTGLYEQACKQDEQQLYRSSSLEPVYQQQHRHQHDDLQILPMQQWQVHDVCDWVDRLGLPQYRKKLMHHCIDGHLLTQLTDQQLKGDVGIGPLGHRYMLLQAVKAAQAADLAAAAMGMTPHDCSPAAATAILAAGQVAAAAMHRLVSRPWTATGGAGHHGQLSNGGVPPACVSSADCVAWRRRPSSAPCRSRSQSPIPQASSPGALGPAAGRTSVYEQRAKILFELGRAQARAAAQCSTAAQVEDVARLAAEEVARLKGQLADLDKKNKLQVAHCSGSVDNKGQIPWQHVGAGTRAADPHPESLARPWDPPDADLTFQPRISKNSLRIMAESRGQDGAGGFLDRLESDLRRRETKMRDLQRRYQGRTSNSPPAGPAAAKATSADIAVVADYLSQRGWANIAVNNGQDDDLASQELDEQLNEVVESHRKQLNISDAQAQAILAARGTKKVTALAAAIRTCQFMDRYKVDLSTRGSRLQELQDKWFKQQLSTAVARPGTAAPMTQEQRDLASAVEWFQDLGWGDGAQDDDCDELLSALIKRSRAFKTEAEKLHDKAQAAGIPAAGQQAAALKPDINWQALPWSADGLNTKVQKVMDARKAAAEAAAARAAPSRPSAVTTQAAAALHTVGSAPGGTAESSGSGSTVRNPLEHAVQLLAGMRWAGLDKLDAAVGRAKKLAVYRALRTQSFLEFTAADLAAREAKQRAQWEAFEASRRGKLVSKQELDEFYRRLQEDGERRKVQLETAKAVQAEKEAKALAMMKAANSAKSSRYRPKSAQ